MKSDAENQTHEFKIDLIVIGNSNTGKTSLIRRFTKGQQPFMHSVEPTIGISLEKKTVNINNKLVSIQIWDTSGQEKFFSIVKSYFKRADGILIIFDLTDKASFDSKIEDKSELNNFWISEITDNSPENCCKIIQLTYQQKYFQQRGVSYESGKNLAESLGVRYVETSAKTGEMIDDAIISLAKECINKISSNKDTGINLVNFQPPEESGCIGAIKKLFSKSSSQDRKVPSHQEL